MTEPTDAMLAELVASHAAQRAALTLLTADGSVMKELADLKATIATMRTKQERMDAFLAKHYARSDTDLGAAAREVYGDDVADKVSHNSGRKELLGTVTGPTLHNSGWNSKHFRAWSGGVAGGDWILASDSRNACCGATGTGTKFTSDVADVTCPACRDVIKSHPCAPVGFDPWKETT